MNIDIAIMLFPIIFMVHEFEEIILFKNWVARHKINPKVKQHIWIKKYSHQPITTAAFSVMIAEEFVIVSTLSVLAASYSLFALFAGLLIAYAVHLVGHVGAVAYYRQYVPGAASALLTLPLVAWLFFVVNTHVHLDVRQVCVWAVVVGLILIGNLFLLHSLSGWIQRQVGSVRL